MKARLAALTFAALLVVAAPLPGHAAGAAPATPAPAVPAASPTAPAAPAQALAPRPSIVPPAAAPSLRHAERRPVRRPRHRWHYARRHRHYRHWAYWQPYYWPHFHVYWSRIPWFGF